MSDNPMIYCFGNSHVSIFSGQDVMQPIWPGRSKDTLPYFRTIRLGPVTAWGIYKSVPTIIDICNQIGFRKANDTILMVLGEVDMRAHVLKQAELQNRPVNDIVADVVQNYFLAIDSLLEEGFVVAVFGCIAGFVLQPGAQQPPWPHVGTVLQRNMATKEFNNLVERECAKRGLIFVSVFDEMINGGMKTKTKYLDTQQAGCHLTTRILPLMLWKFRDVGLISWEVAFLPQEGGIHA